MAGTPDLKVVWTDADFEQMGWHDNRVHGLSFEDDGEDARLLLDIDYIVRWIEPEPPAEYFTFMIAPATLVFEGVEYLEGGIVAGDGGTRTALIIEGLDPPTPEPEHGSRTDLRRWDFVGHNFELSFLALGFHQHFRMRPIHVVGEQFLSREQRDGISFATPSEWR